MKKTFHIEDNEYTVKPCTAIAYCDLEWNVNDEPIYNEEARQNALFVEKIAPAGEERVQAVVFCDWKLDALETDEDFAAMCEDSWAWESDYETLDSVLINGLPLSEYV